MKQKQVIARLVEVLYLAVMFLYLLVLKTLLSTSSSYDLWMFFCFAGIIIGLLVLVGPKFNRYLGFILAFLYTLYLVAQTIYHRAFGQFFRFSTALSLSKEVAGVSDSVIELIKFSDLLPFIVLIVLTVVFVVCYFIFQRELVYNYKYRLASLLFLGLGLSAFFYNAHTIKASAEGWTNFDIYKSDYYVYDSLPNTNQFVDKFGLLNLLYRDGEMTINRSQLSGESKSEIDDFFNDKTSMQNTNDFTGIFKDKSVLLIQAESFMNLGFSEEFTPNLYYYMQNGLYVENFNTPLLTGSTSDTEFMSNTSIIPASSGYPVCYEHINNTYPLTLGNIFKANGYDTFAYHNNYAEYYNRDVTFEKYGYEFFDSYKLGLENLEPDTKLAESIGWILSEKPKFLGYWITFSGHQPYSLDAVGVSEEDVKVIKEKYPNLNDEYVSYIAKAMDVDQSLLNFLNIMDWTGRLNDVVIVFYGDHMAKGLDFSKGSNYDQVFGVNSDDNPDIISTPLLIYSPSGDLPVKEYQKVSTTLDILPTLVNMWGFDEDMRYAMGNDIFNPNYEGFYFDEAGNLASDNFRYNIISQELKLNGNYSEADAQEDISYFNKLKDIAFKILQLDYFKQ